MTSDEIKQIIEARRHLEQGRDMLDRLVLSALKEKSELDWSRLKAARASAQTAATYVSLCQPNLSPQ